MSRIVIHIGMHKTATTHVQDTFHQNRRLLKRYGVIFPYIGHTRGQHGLASAWIKMPSPYSIRDPRSVWRKLAKTYSRTNYTVFVSSEELSRLHPSRVDMLELREIVSDFDEVLVLCTLRDQASFIQSVYQQVSVERQPGDWEPYLHRALDALIVDGLALNYHDILRHVLRGFERHEVRFLSYETAVKSSGGIEVAMLREAGILNVPADQFTPFGDGKSNVSPPPLATFLANALSKPDVAKAGLVNSLSKIVRVHAGEKRAIIFSQRELERVANTFAPLNRKLENAVSEIQPDFRVGHMLGSQNFIFRGQLQEDFWIDVCRNLLSSLRT